MMETIRIRLYRREDLSQVEALAARVQPYRPEDEADVNAMFERSLRAKQSHDPRWMDYPVYRERTMEEEYDAFWVAELPQDGTNSFVGVVGIQELRAGEAISAHHPLVEGWKRRGRVAELRYLRVEPEARGQSLGTRLCQTVIEWAQPRFRTLVVNTTTPQRPALQLYRKLGFQEAGLSYLDRYELVWLELDLKPTSFNERMRSTC